MSEFRDAANSLFEVLDRIGVAYAVGGSVASSLHGIARATQALDLVVDLPLMRTPDLYAAVSSDFYADEDAMRDAIRRGMSFNLIHLKSGLKFDLFIAARHPLGRDQLAHRRLVETALLGGEAIRFQVISPEDIVLAKLFWYRQGGDASERQWNDLTNLMTVQRGRLDLTYLKPQALRLGIADLLARLLAE